MAERQQDIETLKRRGRRRLVGAVALVLAAVIVLPMVFDPEPRGGAPAVSVRIPGEDESPFKPKPVPRPAEKKAEQKAVEQKAAEQKVVEQKAEIPAAPTPAPKKAEKKVEEKAILSKPAPSKPSPSERARAEAALAGAEFVIPVGAFTNPDGVVAKLAAAKVPYYTEAVGSLTRVRAGPFASKQAAEKARGQLKDLGLDPGAITSRAG
jgi:DedD protein